MIKAFVHWGHSHGGGTDFLLVPEDRDFQKDCSKWPGSGCLSDWLVSRPWGYEGVEPSDHLCVHEEDIRHG